jgi:hypothetical protein
VLLLLIIWGIITTGMPPESSCSWTLCCSSWFQLEGQYVFSSSSSSSYSSNGSRCLCPRKYCSLQAFCRSPALEVPAYIAWSPSHLHRRQTSSMKRGNYGRKKSGEFCRQIENSTIFEGNFYTPQICNMGPKTLLPLKGRIFSPWKIRWLRPGFFFRTRELGYHRPAW